jgi:hypothetical protein
MEIAPDLPMRGWSRSRIVSPVISHHLHMPLPAGCPAAGVMQHQKSSPVDGCRNR